MSDIGHRVFKAESGLYWVRIGNELVSCKARSRLKKGSIIVGDFVDLDYLASEYVINSVFQRKNKLVRPSIANVDQIMIVAASVPDIDYMLVDKLIINATRQDISVILCINKSDIGELFLEGEYGQVVEKIINISAINGDIDSVRELLKGKLTCIAGQSAVGKSTLINALLGSDAQKTAEVSRKILRGKNTTTSAEIFSLPFGMVVDTPGFSVVDVFDILPKELKLYYPEFDDYVGDCKFSTCLHLNEAQCAVREAAERGKISINRYERYKKIYAECKDFYDKNYKARASKSTYES